MPCMLETHSEVGIELLRVICVSLENKLQLSICLSRVWSIHSVNPSCKWYSSNITQGLSHTYKHSLLLNEESAPSGKVPTALFPRWSRCHGTRLLRQSTALKSEKLRYKNEHISFPNAKIQRLNRNSLRLRLILSPCSSYSPIVVRVFLRRKANRDDTKVYHYTRGMIFQREAESSIGQGIPNETNDRTRLEQDDMDPF